MRAVYNSSKPSSGKTKMGAGRDRQVTTIKPRSKTAPTSLKSHPIQIWGLRLRFWQRRVGIVTSILIAGTLVTYSSTVYLQQQWNQKYRRLENLQRQERQLTANNEILKNQLAVEAEQPLTKLSPPNPADAIILPAAKQNNRPFVKPDALQKIDIPAGY